MDRLCLLLHSFCLNDKTETEGYKVCHTLLFWAFEDSKFTISLVYVYSTGCKYMWLTCLYQPKYCLMGADILSCVPEQRHVKKGSGLRSSRTDVVAPLLTKTHIQLFDQTAKLPRLV